MRTDDLIAALAADAGSRAPPPGRALAIAGALGAAGAAALFLATLGVRPDWQAAIGTLRYPLKFVITLALALAAGRTLARLARPLPAGSSALRPLLLPAGLIAAAVTAELAMVEPERWGAVARGTNSLLCLTFIPMLSALPLAAATLALRSAAPANPTVAGAVAGLFAGGIGATFYAAHCPDDSPLFVAIWYGIAVLVLAGIGALAGRRFAAW